MPKIIIKGAVSTFDGSYIDDFIVFFNRKQISNVTCYKNLESPEFRKEFPKISSSSNSGFNLEFSLHPEDFQDIYNYTIFICPMSNSLPCNTRSCSVIPPHFRTPKQKDIQFVGGNFFIVGFEFLGHLIKYADLSQNDKVLDVGCGCGRIAYPLSVYFSKEGFYDGFDIWDSGIEWAQEHITSNNPNFNFRKIDI